MMKFIFTIVYIMFTTLGLFFLKLGGSNPLTITLKNGFCLKIGFLSMLGFLFYVCSFLLWQKLLSSYDLTYIVPITTGIVQSIVLILGIAFFKEKVNAMEILGILLVIIGITIMAFAKK